MKYYIGVDLGGTNIAIGIVNQDMEIVRKTSIPTDCPRDAEEIVDDIVKTIGELCVQMSIEIESLEWIGVGTPGSVNSETGVVERAHNLGFYDTPLMDIISDRISAPCFVENDANAAAYGEFLAGAAKGAKNAVCVTIGTGIGGGIIIDSKIYSGSNFFGAELGHMVIDMNGKQCNCGRKGCMEQYCSATALIEQTKEAMLNNKYSVMWELCGGELEKVSGRTAFDAMKKDDETAKNIIKTYIGYLGCGITNLINIFQPDILMVGGGISKEGETLLAPIREYVSRESFDCNPIKATKIVAAQLGNDAGIIGAAMLGLLHQ